ncbi:GW dipeptide domain-containing protein [Carnobacterium pleistocenium]|uniref:GW dipeptide domain-containing protein n=1 Tax=Carnobacterium pleistocenium TaxID=181073 RepID=UPI0005593DB8|nr:GW dipeptide domain-containing protein [Carnobacterium pleistocenium]
MGNTKKRLRSMLKSITVLTVLATLTSSIAPAAVSASEIINKERVEETQAQNYEGNEQENSLGNLENSESLSSQSNEEESQTATSESIHSETMEEQTDENDLDESTYNDFSKTTESRQKKTEEETVIDEEFIESFKADGSDSVNKSDYVHYDALVVAGDQPVFSKPGYTVGAKKLGETTTYLNQSVLISQEKVTVKGIWAEISINNEIIGWVAKDTLNINFDEIIDQKMVHYDAVIMQGRHDVYTLPGYTEGNVLITKASTYLNQKINVVQIIKTSRATWIQFSINGATIGWMNIIGVNLKYDSLEKTEEVHYDATVEQGRHDVYTLPGYTQGNEIITKASTYLNQTVQIDEEKVTDRAIWVLISQNGKIIGWMNKKGIKAVEYNDTISESRSVHYEATVSKNNQLIFSAPGYTKDSKAIANTKDYYKNDTRILEEKITKRATWALISVNNKTIGWVDKAHLTVQYDSIKTTKAVHYDALVEQGRHDIYTAPGYTKGNEIITKASSYLNKKAYIVNIAETGKATWAQFSINGKIIGWMNIIGLSIQYDKIISSNKVNIIAKVVEGRHDVYTIPGYTKNNELITKSETYLNKNITIVKEIKTARATWALITLNGETIGWMNKKGLSIIKVNFVDEVSESRNTHNDAIVSKKDQLIYSAPGFTSGAKEIGNTSSYLNKKVQITQEKETDRATWAQISINNKNIGWVNKTSVTLKYDTIQTTKDVHFDAVVSQGRHDVYTVPGYTKGNKIIAKSSSYLNKKVLVSKILKTNRATWAQISVSGKVVGWMNIIGLTVQYDKILDTKKVHYEAVVVQNQHDVYSKPGYTENNQRLTKSSTYLSKKAIVTQIVKTKRATWVEISINGKTPVWMNKNGLKIKYDKVNSTKTTNYNAKVVEGQHDIYTVPGYTDGNIIVGKSGSYLNKNIRIIQEKQTARATWALISINGKTIGWMNKKGIDSIISIYLDPGHGGDDPGAISGGVTEKVLNLKIALKVEKLLKGKGYEVIMSRRTDKFVSLSDRAQEANKMKVDIFVSVHHNSFMKTAYGIETYSYNGLGNPKNIMSSNSNRLLISTVLSNEIHKRLISNTGAYNRNNRKANFHVIRETTMPAVLLELGYLDNTNERAKLVTDNYQNKLAKGIVEGIVNYFN